MIVGIDVGGTFTDIVFFDGRRLHHEKIPSIPHAPHEAVREGIALLGDRKIIVTSESTATLAEGDRFYIETAGGGGWGKKSRVKR
jgi:N-methylhydantoinase A